MMEKLKSIRLNVSLTAVICILLGIVFIACPDTVTNIATMLIGIALIIVGIVIFISRILNEEWRIPGFILAAIIAAIGIFICTHAQGTSEFVSKLILIVIGVVFIINGFEAVTMAANTRSILGRAVSENGVWWIGILFGVLDIVFGIVCIAGGFNLFNVMNILIGVMLIYDGLSSMLVVHKVNSAERYVRSKVSDHKDDNSDLV